MALPDLSNSKLRKIVRFVKAPARHFEAEFQADGLAVTGKNMAFLDEPAFRDAWEFSVSLNRAGWNDDVPDVRWRAHVACWAASHCSHLPGDFAEFGVHTGIFSLTICRFLKFGTLPKRYFLYDTFRGIPIDDRMPEAEREHATLLNGKLYFDCFDISQKSFSHFPNATLVRGILPDSLDMSAFGKLAFVHIDLNNSVAEMGVIEKIWDRIVPGGIVLLDDYCFRGYEAQYEAWNRFCAERQHMVLSLPTGQGMIFKH
ncbi:MAG: TylF/MycF/NovP-related O-methyltransferase [Beijerinckiaceae bacterium]